MDEVGDTKATLKLVTKSQPEMPCLRLLTEANLRTLDADATITSPGNAHLNDLLPSESLPSPVLDEEEDDNHRDESNDSTKSVTTHSYNNKH